MNDYTLPEGWASAADPSGHTYFYHALTGESSWERPAAQQNETQQHDDQHEKDNHHQQLPEGWFACAAGDGSGSVYYYNASTGESTWALPVAAPAPAPASATATAAAANTGQTASSEQEHKHKHRKASLYVLPEGWSQHTDARDGSVYYHNSASATSTWVRPGAGPCLESASTPAPAPVSAP